MSFYRMGDGGGWENERQVDPEWGRKVESRSWLLAASLASPAQFFSPPTSVGKRKPSACLDSKNKTQTPWVPICSHPHSPVLEPSVCRRSHRVSSVYTAAREQLLPRLGFWTIQISISFGRLGWQQLEIPFLMLAYMNVFSSLRLEFYKV